jgi:hypothetical protein
MILALAGIVPNRVVAKKAAKLRLMARPDGRGAELFMEEGQTLLFKWCPSPRDANNLISLY